MEFSSHCPEGSLTTCTFRIEGKPAKKIWHLQYAARQDEETNRKRIWSLTPPPKRATFTPSVKFGPEALNESTGFIAGPLPKIDVAIKKNYDIASRQLNPLSIGQLGVGAPFSQKVKDNNKRRGARDMRLLPLPGRLWKHHGAGHPIEEDTASSLTTFQHIGKHIHLEPPHFHYRCLGQEYGTNDQVFKPAKPHRVNRSKANST